MNQKELKELIEFLIEKDIAEFELERGDVKVKIKRAGEHTVVYARAEMPYAAGGPVATAAAGCRRSCCSRSRRRRPARLSRKKTFIW